jgi:diadenosine tetraphosphatase ApaH/serine/threonine PP2A family protein phosphatase
MKIGVLSDVHGNLEALTAVLNFIGDRADYLVSLGDVVGYGPDPAQCIDILSGRKFSTLRGNHEESLLKDDFSRLKDTARLSLEWTKEKLPTTYIKQFEEWPLTEEREGVFFVHASISNPLYKYILRTKDTEEEFPLLKDKICFIGHTHAPGGFRQEISGGKTEVIFPDFSGGMQIKTEENYRYIINVGSVGQPRDGFPFACIALYDTQEKGLALSRVAYDLETTRRKIIEAGLPSVLARRIMQAI